MENKTIDEKTLQHLAELARLKTENDRKLLNELGEILNYFEELKEIDAATAEPLLNVGAERNVFSEDKPRSADETTAEDLRKFFPETENNFLKTPAVFQEQ